MGWQGRPPGRIVGEIRLGIRPDDPDNDLRDDAAADLAQVVARALNRGLAEDVKPEGRLILPIAERELVRRERLCPQSAGDRFAWREAGSHSALQVPRGE